MWRFHPRLVPTLATVLGLVVFGSLCAWQLRRMGEARVARVAAEAKLAAEPFEATAPPGDPGGRRATVKGEPDWSAVSRQPAVSPAYEPGFRMIVPVAGVRVDVGFVPEAAWNEVLAAERAIPGPRAYTGLARADAEGWLLVDGEGYARGRSSADREPPIAGWEIVTHERPHGEYAATWAACALIVLGMWASSSFSRTASS